jgi:transcriptional regulator with XRE-family HTH domain
MSAIEEGTLPSVAVRLGQRLAAARERSQLPVAALARHIGSTAEELRAAEQGGSLSTRQLERLAAATGQSIEFFLAAADDEPVGTLLRAQDATRSSTRSAVDWFEQFIERYEFLASRSGD